ncbi:hypothetical protein ACP275_02G186900 [Erythranthe tilingii]
MAEPVVKTDQEKNELVDNVREEGNDDENDGNLETNEYLLPGLNLVIILSFLSLSAEERSSIDEATPEIETHDHGKNGVTSKSDIQTRRQQLNQFQPAVQRQTSKVHTKIRDCRHSRRL